MLISFKLLTSFVLIASFVGISATQATALTKRYDIEKIYPQARFDRPVDIQSIAGDTRLFVVEQQGFVRSYNKQTQSISVVLDLRNKVHYDQSEKGLLGLALDPRFKENGFFYVNYTAQNPDRTVIARYEMINDSADPLTERVILSFAQPYPNHNGGQLTFGPDAMLYIATGDGGYAGDPHNFAQSLQSPLGKILRIDVSSSSPEKPYDIPASNPFYGRADAFAEIYAFGLRNPWRMSFDSEGRLWAADVGQNKYEEINLITSGGNYGWRVKEGHHCFNPEKACEDKSFVEPIHEYGRSLGQSITGGYVYQGSRNPELRGLYIFSDFMSGSVWALDPKKRSFWRPQDQQVIKLCDTGLNIPSFGLDNDGELIILGFDGSLYQIKEI